MGGCGGDKAHSTPCHPLPPGSPRGTQPSLWAGGGLGEEQSWPSAHSWPRGRTREEDVLWVTMSEQWDGYPGDHPMVPVTEMAPCPSTHAQFFTRPDQEPTMTSCGAGWGTNDGSSPGGLYVVTGKGYGQIQAVMMTVSPVLEEGGACPGSRVWGAV